MKVKLTFSILSVLLVAVGSLAAQETRFFTGFEFIDEGEPFLADFDPVNASVLNGANDQVGEWSGDDFPVGHDSSAYWEDEDVTGVAGFEDNPFQLDDAGRLLFIDRPVTSATMFANLTAPITNLGAEVSFIAGTRRTGGGGAKDYDIFGLDSDGNESFRVRVGADGSTQRLGYVLGDDVFFDLPTSVGNDQANDLQNTGGPPFGAGDDFGDITVKLGGTGYTVEFENLNGSNAYNTTILPFNGTATELAQVGIFYRGAAGTGQQAGFFLDEILVTGFDDLLQGDFNSDGAVNVDDFSILVANFNTAGGADKGDFNFDGQVNLLDFAGLKQAFNANGPAAAAVPEPGGLTLFFVGALAALMLRGRKLAVLPVACCALAFSVGTAEAADFDARLIRLDPSGANSQVNSTLEALDILGSTAPDVVIAEDVSAKLDIIDLAGNAGSFSEDKPYPNGVNDNSMSDFLVNITAILEIPAGDWSVGFNVDDGGYVRMAGVEFLGTYNENGTTGSNDSFILNNTGGFRWAMGEFTLGEPTMVQFQAAFFERGGGDGFEVAAADFLVESNDPDGFELLTDGLNGWKIIETTPGDVNFDGAVNIDDFNVLTSNFGSGDEFAEGDLDFSGRTDLRDFVAFREIFSAGGGPAAAAVPEPASICLLLSSALSCMLLRRRR